MVQVVEYLPCKHKALSSNPRTAKNNTKPKKSESPNVRAQIIREVNRKDVFHIKK
jgi:hypothetical protein